MSGRRRDAADVLVADDPAERRRMAARRRWGRVFRIVTLLPVVAGLLLITTLLVDVTVNTISWQIVEPANSGESFAWSDGFRPFGTWETVVRLELVAQGLAQDDIDRFLADADEVRKFRARNRVELMLSVDGRPLRWVVTNSRDRRVADVDVFAGARSHHALLARLEPGQRLQANPWLDVSFFTKNASRTPVMAGLLNALLGSLWVIGLVVTFSLPLGVGTAVYLEEYAPDTRLTRFLDLNVRNLAGVPSIVYGILGLYVFVRLAGLGPTVLAAAATLTLLILPVVVIASREAIRSVPGSLRQAAYGMGATRLQTVWTVVLPSAVNGIVTGVILAVARALGETAPLLLVGAAAFVPKLPDGPLSIYTVVPIQIYSWVSENDREFQHVASAGIVALLLVLVVLYAAAFLVRLRFERRW